MWKRLLVLGACYCCWLSPSFAYTGNEMLPSCKRNALSAKTSREVYQWGQCMGMIDMLFQLGDALQPLLRFCSPQGSTLGQALDVVVQYLERTPATRHLNFVILAQVALQDAWPCANKNPPN